MKKHSESTGEYGARANAKSNWGTQSNPRLMSLDGVDIRALPVTFVGFDQPGHAMMAPNSALVASGLRYAFFMMSSSRSERGVYCCRGGRGERDGRPVVPLSHREVSDCEVHHIHLMSKPPP